MGELYERGCAYFGEGKVLRWAAGALLPIEEELAIAVCEAGSGVDVEFGEGAVDPVSGAFELSPGADGGFVKDEMGEGGIFGIDGVGPLGAVLLVDKGGGVAELLEDGGKGRGLGDSGLSLDADLVAGGVDGGFEAGFALVGDRTEGAVLADAEDLFALAEIAGGSVVEGVVFEGARGVEVEA